MNSNIYPVNHKRSATDLISDEYSDVVAIRQPDGDLLIEQSNREMIPVGEMFTQGEYEEYCRAETNAELMSILEMTPHEQGQFYAEHKARMEECIQRIIEANKK